MKIILEFTPNEILDSVKAGTLQSFMQGFNKAEEVMANIAPKAKKAEKPAPDPEETPIDIPEPTATIDQVRAKLAPLLKGGKQKQIEKIFKSFGAEKLTEIAPKDYAALIEMAAEYE